MRKQDNDSYYAELRSKEQFSIKKKVVELARDYWPNTIFIALLFASIVLVFITLPPLNENSAIVDFLWPFIFVCVARIIVVRAPWLSEFIVGKLLNPFFIFLIAVGGIIMLALAWELFWNVVHVWQNPISDNEGGILEDFHALLRNLIWSIGGVGVAIGLWFADQRQKALSKQVQVEMDQSFNEKLGRGVELLANEKNVTSRIAGIRVLVDLANNASQEQRPIIVSVIYNFFCEGAKFKYKNGKRSSVSKNDSRKDLQYALDFILDLSMSEREECNRKLNLFNDDKTQLHFASLDFSRLVFSHKRLENIKFENSYFFETTFDVAEMVDVGFFGVEIEESFFGFMKVHRHPVTGMMFIYPPYRKIVDSHFHCKFIKKTKFYNLEIEKTHFFCDDMVDVSFSQTKFFRGYFSVKNEVKVSETSILPYFIGTDLWSTNFNFEIEIDISEHFELCYYRENQHLSKLSKMYKSRRYEAVHNLLVFVESSQKWSREPAYQWVEKEVAEWKLEQAKETGENTTKLKKDVIKAKKEWQEVRADFKKRQTQADKPTPNPK